MTKAMAAILAVIAAVLALLIGWTLLLLWFSSPIIGTIIAVSLVAVARFIYPKFLKEMEL